jgi:hypothetical protein
MSDRSAGVEKVRRLCDELSKAAERDPERLPKLVEGLERLLAPPVRKPPGSRGNRRAKPVLDPFEVYRAEPDALKARLGALDLERLRDVVAHHGMDPRRLVMKWKDRERVIQHIIETVEARSRKGDAFRGSSRPDN